MVLAQLGIETTSEKKKKKIEERPDEMSSTDAPAEAEKISMVAEVIEAMTVDLQGDDEDADDATEADGETEGDDAATKKSDENEMGGLQEVKP